MKRWDTMSTTRLCFKAAIQLEASVKALTDSARALQAADDEAGRAAAGALEEARRRLLEARKALQAEALSRSPLSLAR